MNKNLQLFRARRIHFVSRVSGLLIITLLGACASALNSGRSDSAGNRTLALASPASAEVIQALAPTGVLRVGAYPDSPTSMVRDASTGQQVGITFEMGQMLAKQLGVPMKLVEYPRVAQVIEGVKTGAVDFTFTNATEIRAKDMNFAQPLVKLELGYLVPSAGQATRLITKIDDIDRPGVRVGVSQGSSSQGVLGKQFKSATLVTADSLKLAQDLLSQGRIDAFATNKGILFEMAETLNGVRILEGRWGIENLAIAMQKSGPAREAALEYLRRFGAQLQASGELAAMIKRAALKGVAVDE